jgi:hypothetical protein
VAVAQGEAQRPGELQAFGAAGEGVPRGRVVAELAEQGVEVGEVAQQVVGLALVEEVRGAVQDQVGQGEGAHAGQAGISTLASMSRRRRA